VLHSHPHSHPTRRSSDLPRVAPSSGLSARGAARGSVGLHLRRHGNRDGARAPDPRKDRSRSRRAASSRHCVGRRLSVGPMSLLDAVELAAIAAGVTIVALSIAALAMRARDRRSIGAQIVALAWSTVLAVIAGAYAASRAMFISQHDLTALVVVLAAAGGVAILIASVLAAR